MPRLASVAHPAAGTSPLSTFGINPKYPIVGTSPATPTTGVQIPLFSNLPATGTTSGFSFLNASRRCESMPFSPWTKAWIAENTLSSASRYTEQHPGFGSPGRARAHRDQGAVGWSANRYLRRCFPASDCDSADYFRRYDLPECGRREHDA